MAEELSTGGLMQGGFASGACSVMSRKYLVKYAHSVTGQCICVHLSAHVVTCPDFLWLHGWLEQQQTHFTYTANDTCVSHINCVVMHIHMNHG